MGLIQMLPVPIFLFFVCFIVGIGVCYLYITLLSIDVELFSLFGIPVSIAFGLMFVFFKEVRCIFILLIPSFAGQSGRIFIITLITILTISGPLISILLNFKDGLKVLSCLESLNFNLTKNRFDLIYDPVQEMITEFVIGSKEFERIGQKIKDGFKPIIDEIKDKSEITEIEVRINLLDRSRNENRVERINLLHKYLNEDTKGEKIEKKYRRKLHLRCEDIFNLGIQKCEEIFYESERKCYEILPVVGTVVCWPLKLYFICKIKSWLSGLPFCDTIYMVNSGFGEAFLTALKASDELSKGFKVSVIYKVNRDRLSWTQYSSKLHIEEDIMKIFEGKEIYIMRGLRILQRLLAFSFILVFISTMNYHRHYLQDIEYDNIYISDYFERIDARRKQQGKRNLLPLTKVERKDVTRRISWQIINEEKRQFTATVLFLIPQSITVCLILFFDNLLTDILKIIRQHGNIKYEQPVQHNIQVFVDGTGFLARMIRKFVNHINAIDRIHHVYNPKACLPNPVQTSRIIILSILCLYLLLLVVILFQVYIRRLRSKVCGYFHRKWEKRRTLYLYNECLRRRNTFIHLRRCDLRQKFKLLVLEQNESGVSTIDDPAAFQKACCIVCDDHLDKKPIFCLRCKSLFCLHCWTDMEESCSICIPFPERSPGKYEPGLKKCTEDESL